MTWLERNEVIIDDGKELTDSEDKSNIPEISEEEIIRKFLKKNNLENFIAKFKKEKLLSYEILPKLTDSDLEKIGIQTMGERKKALKLFSGETLNDFKNEILYGNLSEEDKKDLSVFENEVLKRNQFSFIFEELKENGALTLYFNRIEWVGVYNNFVISIANITDVSIESDFGETSLVITDCYTTYEFRIEIEDDRLLATDIEVWRQKIEAQRIELKKKPNNFGIPEGKPELLSQKGKKLGGCFFDILFGIIILGVAVALFYVNNPNFEF